MNWEAFGAIVAATVAVLGGHVWLMKQVIDGSIAKLLLAIADKYATKEDLANHVDTMHK